MDSKDMTEIKKLVEELEKCKEAMYVLLKAEAKEIITNNIRDENRIDRLFDQILAYNPDERFLALFWEMIKYVETFDDGIGAFYRRIEKVLNTGE